MLYGHFKWVKVRFYYYYYFPEAYVKIYFF